ncbi:transglutaminase domain-containing protein [Streptomyces sp. NBC_00620]|uniref:transglutaminase domain-containing protein n=1 Tax=Streptomyces sp. NBC_00620 TaxID=2903666 RepID=UPI00225255F7|nr:transglutaminase domain-containing protein [Streptomyces sp. NBC_00620]MCX4972411.1 transglutaminase-like domain-containing protein [Streptomyces sp. NBC_00620]
MTSRLLMPYRRNSDDVPVDAQEPVRGSTRPTATLDWAHPAVGALVERIPRSGDARESLRVAHGIIAREVLPVYSVDDLRRASRTLKLGRGSCSQRMAVLEAVARAVGVPTRVRGLLVDGRFWYPRFPRLKPLVPEQVLLAWPEFQLEGQPDGQPDRQWVPIAELFGTLTELSEAGGFSNHGGETLFDAVARTAVDWDGTSAASCAGPGTACDLSAQVRVDLGHFTSRDELFARHDQTLCRPARTLAEPVLGRWSAGARTVTA